MFGVRREGVTEAAGHLQRAGLIRCSRGHISMLDRDGLERHSCECYGVVKREYEKALAQGVLGNIAAFAKRLFARSDDPSKMFLQLREAE